MSDYHIVIGYGEIGQSIYNVLKKKYSVGYVDLGREEVGEHEKAILHICLPYSDKFANIVEDYVKRFNPVLVINHSTVPLGTTSKIGQFAVHSPVRGVHPHLEDGIMTFVKFFGGQEPYVSQAARIFEDLGVKCVKGNSIDTEAGKLLDTTYYAWVIMFERWVHEYCELHGIDFNIAYTQFNASYNEGYISLGKPNVVRPTLSHENKAIGGHCLIPNAQMMAAEDFEPARIIVDKNKDLQKKFG